MKIIQILGHPITVMVTFLILLISGEAFGGPYLIYLILGLPHFADYAVTGAAGIVILLLVTVYPGHLQIRLKSILVIIGIILLVISLYFFFAHDGMRYNHATFEQTVPLVTIYLFGLTVLCGLISSLWQLSGWPSSRFHS